MEPSNAIVHHNEWIPRRPPYQPEVVNVLDEVKEGRRKAMANTSVYIVNPQKERNPFGDAENIDAIKNEKWVWICMGVSVAFFLAYYCLLACLLYLKLNKFSHSPAQPGPSRHEGRSRQANEVKSEEFLGRRRERVLSYHDGLTRRAGQVSQVMMPPPPPQGEVQVLPPAEGVQQQVPPTPHLIQPPVTYQGPPPPPDQIPQGYTVPQAPQVIQQPLPEMLPPVQVIEKPKGSALKKGRRGGSSKTKAKAKKSAAKKS